jgi:hypothetical protein
MHFKSGRNTGIGVCAIVFINIFLELLDRNTYKAKELLLDYPVQ